MWGFCPVLTRQHPHATQTHCIWFPNLRGYCSFVINARVSETWIVRYSNCSFAHLVPDPCQNLKYPSSEPQTYLLVSQEPGWHPEPLTKPFRTTSVFLDHPVLWVSAILQSASHNQDVNMCCPCLHYSYFISKAQREERLLLLPFSNWHHIRYKK